MTLVLSLNNSGLRAIVMSNVLDTGLCGCNLHVLHLDYNLLLIKSWIIAIVSHLSVTDIVSLVEGPFDECFKIYVLKLKLTLIFIM